MYLGFLKEGDTMTDNRIIYQRTFTKKLEQVGVPFHLERDKIYFIWQGVNCCLVYSADNKLELHGRQVTSFAKQQLALAYGLCNELNKQINWLKFIVSKENELICTVTSAVNPDDVVEEALELLTLMQKAVSYARQQLVLL